jgi:hypothetical protein
MFHAGHGMTSALMRGSVRFPNTEIERRVWHRARLGTAWLCVLTRVVNYCPGSGGGTAMDRSSRGWGCGVLPRSGRTGPRRHGHEIGDQIDRRERVHEQENQSDPHASRQVGVGSQPP